jgi:hypothetical protein
MQRNLCVSRPRLSDERDADHGLGDYPAGFTDGESDRGADTSLRTE